MNLNYNPCKIKLSSSSSLTELCEGAQGADASHHSPNLVGLYVSIPLVYQRLHQSVHTLVPAHTGNLDSSMGTTTKTHPHIKEVTPATVSSNLIRTVAAWARCSAKRQHRATYPHLPSRCLSQVFNKKARQSYLPSPAQQLFDKLVRQCYLPSSTLQLLEPGVQQTSNAELPTLTCTATVWARCSTNRQARATYPHLHCNYWSQVFNKQARQCYLPSPALQLSEPGVQQTGKAELPTLTCTATVWDRCSKKWWGRATCPNLLTCTAAASARVKKGR